MVSKIFQITGIVTALIFVVGVTYGLCFTFYQPKIDNYQEQLTDLEAQLTVANDDIESLNDWKTILENQKNREIELNNDLREELDALEILYQDFKNDTFAAFDQLKVDQIFLEKRLNQHTIITHSFEDEAILWLDIKYAAADVDQNLIPMIDTLIDDYRDLYVWIDSLPEGEISEKDAAVLMFDAYQILWKILQEDIRTFDAKWIDIIINDISELKGKTVTPQGHIM